MEEDHNQITTLQNEIRHVWRELADLKAAIQDQTKAINAERVDHEQRIRELEKHQAVLYQRWRIFATLATLMSTAAIVISIVNMLK